MAQREPSVASPDLLVSTTIGVPAYSTPAGDQTSALQGMVNAARASGKKGVAAPNRALVINGPVFIPPDFVLSVGLSGDTRDDINGSPAYDQMPRWIFGPGGYLDCDARQGPIAVRDFIGVGSTWRKVTEGATTGLDDVAMRAALDHQLQGYDNAQMLRFRGDGCEVTGALLLGSQRPIYFTAGARSLVDRVILDCGGTMLSQGQGLTLENSGGAPRWGRIHSITAGIKQVRGVGAFDWLITAAANNGGYTRLTIGPSTYLKFPQWKSGKYIKRNDEIIYLVGGLNYNEYRAKAEGSMGTIPPTHTSGTVTYDGVPWEYLGPYTGVRFDANRPAGFLQPGHRVICNVPPTLLLNRGSAPDWTAAEWDMRYRGHFAVLAAGAQTVGAAEWTIDLPWDASYASTLPGGYMSIYPGMRIAWGIVTDDSDGWRLDSFQNKGPLGAAFIRASNAKLHHASCEDAAEGENARGNLNSLGYYFGDGSAGAIVDGGSHKSVGIPTIVDTGKAQPVEFWKELYGGGWRGMWVRSGSVVVNGGFLRGGAAQFYVGTDAVVADFRRATPDDGFRITGDPGWQTRTFLPEKPSNKSDRRTLALSTPRGGVIGPPHALADWARSTAYLQNDVRRIYDADQNDAWLAIIQNPGDAGTTAATAPALPAAATVGTTIADGTATWTLLCLDRGVLPFVEYDDVSRLVALNYWTNTGRRTKRVVLDASGLSLSGDIASDGKITAAGDMVLSGKLTHAATGVDVISANGLPQLRTRTQANMPAGVAASGLTQIASISDAPGNRRLAYRFENGTLYYLLDSRIALPGPFANDAAAAAGSVGIGGWYTHTTNGPTVRLT